STAPTSSPSGPGWSARSGRWCPTWPSSRSVVSCLWASPTWVSPSRCGQPDRGTAIVVCLTCAAMLVAAGVRIQHLALLAGAIGVILLLAIVIEPYRMHARTGLLHPTRGANG